MKKSKQKTKIEEVVEKKQGQERSKKNEANNEEKELHLAFPRAIPLLSACLRDEVLNRGFFWELRYSISSRFRSNRRVFDQFRD